MSARMCNSCNREIQNTSTVSTKAKDGTMEYYHPWCLRCDACGTQFGKGKVYMDPDTGRRYCTRECYDKGQTTQVTDPKSTFRSEQETKPQQYQAPPVQQFQAPPQQYNPPQAASPQQQQNNNNKPVPRNNCGNCGAKVAAHNKFCGSCGGSLF